MDRFITTLVILATCALATLRAEPPEWAGKPDVSVGMKTLKGMMRYNLDEITVEPGQKVKLTIENPDDLEHNFVLLDVDPQDKDGQKFGELSLALAEKGPALGWVPESDRVLAKSGMIGVKATEDIYFVAPEKTGIYPYICSVPGHYLLMRGKLVVKKQAPSSLRNVTWSLYSAGGNNWNRLPDFNELEPVATGKAKNNLISLDPARENKLNNNYAILFEGEFTVPETDTFEFILNSDDGSRLAIDGEEMIDNDGVHPPQSRNHKEKLEAGEHTFRVGMFNAGGGAELSLIAKAGSIGDLAFSRNKAAGKPKRKAPDPMLLTAENPGEAIVHRTFVGGSKPRGIGVGYPGGINVVWDADVLNLAVIWRGGFMDVSGHWNGRGSGSKIAGFDQVKPGHGLPMQRLESLDDPWVPFYEPKIHYERDKENPQKEITYVDRHPDYQFRGYRVDRKRFPTFLYRYRDLEVTDRLDPAEIDGSDAIVRKIRIEGEAGENVWFRLVENGPASELENGWIDIGNNLHLKVEGAEKTVRTIQNRREILVPVNGPGEFQVTYRYTNPIGGKVKK